MSARKGLLWIIETPRWSWWEPVDDTPCETRELARKRMQDWKDRTYGRYRVRAYRRVEAAGEETK